MDVIGPRLNQSYASAVWQDEVNDYLRALISFLKSVDLADRVIAYQPMAGICGEWIKNVTSMQERCGDYSAPMQRRFQAWLRQRYDDDTSALQDAWASPSVSFDSAQVRKRTAVTSLPYSAAGTSVCARCSNPRMWTSWSARTDMRSIESAATSSRTRFGETDG